VPSSARKHEIFVGTRPKDRASGSVMSKVSNVVQFEASVTVTV